MYRTIFFGSPKVALKTLEFLQSDKDFDVLSVVSQPARSKGRKGVLQDTPVSQWALDQGLPLLKPHKMEECLPLLKELRPNVLVILAYGQIFPHTFFETFPQTMVNLHASLLPQLRGAAPVQRALMQGFVETGVSLQVMKYELDCGDIIGQRTLKLDNSMDASSVFERLPSLFEELLAVDLKQYLAEQRKAFSQDEQQASYAPKIKNEEACIDFTKTAQELHNQVRGLSMGPVTEMRYKGRRVKVYKTQVVENNKQGEGGQVVQVSKDFFDLHTSKGALRILELQLEGKKRLSASNFLKGVRIQEGEVFE